MSITKASGFHYLGPEPNFSRDNFTTLAKLKAFDEDNLPSMFIATCEETGKMYIFNKKNTVDPVLGKWREGGGDGSSDAKIVNTIEEAPNDTIVYSVNDSTLYYKDSLGNAIKISGLFSVNDGVLEF